MLYSLDKYLICGGFLESINSLFSSGTIDEETFERYISVVFSEIEKVKKSRMTSKNVLSSIMDSLGSTISWNKLAKKSGNISTNTLIDYVTIKNSFREGIVVSKNIFLIEKDIVILPSSSFLYLLN